MTFFYFLGLWWPSGLRVRKNLKKGPRKPKKNLPFSCIINGFSQSISQWFFGVFWGWLFLISVAKVFQIRDPWDHFSRHFAAKLENRNLWFRVHQTPLFKVSRGWVWKCWATFFKWFSEVDLGMSFCDFLWDLGSSRTPKWALFQTNSCINWRSIFWWFLEGSGEPTNW